jgi:site-specific DNA recombinase
MPDSTIVLARISDARDGDERGVSQQIGDGLRLAERLGWHVGPAASHHIVENDTSAYKRKRIPLPDGRVELRTVRPGFRRALAMLADGRADAVIAYDLDRTVRDPRDLEDLIDVVEGARPRIPVESVTGSLRLASDADITMARVLVAVANKASRDTARRVARARLRQATDGQFGGGKRRYGFEKDGVTIREAEADEIRRAADAILAGVSLRQVTASLRERQVPTATGVTWDALTLRDILLRPRNAGLLVHRASGSGREGPPYDDSEIVGRAPWEPVIPESSWRAVCAILTDPARRNGPGNTPRYLGSGIYLCGKCDDGTTLAIARSDAGAARHARYTCWPERQRNSLPMSERKWHLSRSAARVDEFVEEAVMAWFERDDATDALPPPPGAEVDLPALQAEEKSILELLNEQARLHARRVLTGEQLEAGSRELQVSLQRVRSAIAATEESSPLTGLVRGPGIREIWPGMDLGRKRAVLRALADVTLLGSARSGRLPDGGYFDPRAVQITWHQ